MNCDDSVDSITASRGSSECSSENKIGLPTTPTNNRDDSVRMARRRNSPLLRNVISNGGNIHNETVDLVRDSSTWAAVTTARGGSKYKYVATRNNHDGSIRKAQRRNSPGRPNVISKGENIRHASVDLVRGSSALAAVKTARGSRKCEDGVSTNNRDDSIRMAQRRSSPRSIISEALSALQIPVSEDICSGSKTPRAVFAVRVSSTRNKKSSLPRHQS